MIRYSNTALTVNITNVTELRTALSELHSSENPINWVLLGYGTGKNDIQFVSKGSGGLEEFKSQLVDNQVQFGVLEVVIAGDEYNPVKFVLLTWIGSRVNAGVAKARSSGHRTELLDEIKRVVSISAEFQPSAIPDITYDNLGQTLSRMRPAYHSSSTASAQRQAMSRSRSQAAKTSQLVVANRESAEAGLREVYEARADWAILAYVPGKRDEVELVTTGTNGIDGLREQFPTDRVFFTILRVKFITTASANGEPVTKFVLVTLVGEKVPPLQKARSGGQRQEITDFIVSVVPVHTHFQPNDPSELTTAAILSKFNE
eukprot:TRINITY_DN270_c2_g1_i1.p1 TRINITY_DN270_c2_g1~~TRINITY_DN270_c2_g1_i1.p1  ORF type:complete len:330 (+),score=163.79 TRINITY_DN270_c2_g1_i1:41-991(+)